MIVILRLLLFGLQLFELHVVCFLSHAQILSSLAATLPDLLRLVATVLLVVIGVGRIERVLAQLFVDYFQLVGCRILVLRLSFLLYRCHHFLIKSHIEGREI